MSLLFETALECTCTSTLFCYYIHPYLMPRKSVYVSVDGIDFKLTVVMYLCSNAWCLAGVTKSCAYVCGRVASALTALTYLRLCEARLRQHFMISFRQQVEEHCTRVQSQIGWLQSYLYHIDSSCANVWNAWELNCFMFMHHHSKSTICRKTAT